MDAAIAQSGFRSLETGLTCTLEQVDEANCEKYNRPILRSISDTQKTVKYIRPECKMWKCENCAKKNKKRWQKEAWYGASQLLQSGETLVHVTITSHEHVRKLEQGIFVWRDAWTTLGARYRRAHPGAVYLYTCEHEKREHFHVHMLTSATMSERWWKDNGRKCGMGHQQKLREVEDAGHAVAYLTKYMTKAMLCEGWPKNWRMVNRSEGWPKMPQNATSDVWEYLTASIYTAMLDGDKWGKRGYRIEVV